VTYVAAIRLAEARSQTIVVSPGQSIQQAVNDASAGDTIFVNPGHYYEMVIVNKAVNLIGANSSTTFIDGDGGGNVLTILSSNVLVRGFTICQCYQQLDCFEFQF
jgi:nitrous oxidase accessory protein